MVQREDPELEESVLRGDSCIAVPVEIYRSTAGELIITAYGPCMETARIFEQLFGADPFAPAALAWLDNHIHTFAESIGYHHNRTASKVILEYVKPASKSDFFEINSTNAILIRTRAEYDFFENLADADPSLEQSDTDVAYVVLSDHKIVSCASVNDIDFGDGSLEINVETATEYRNLGYGSACAMALTQYINQLGYTVRYHCAADNAASIAIANRCKFTLCGNRYSYVCYAIVNSEEKE